MTRYETVLAALAERERLLQRERTAASHARTLMCVMDVLFACDAADDGITRVLAISRDATGADLAVLLVADGQGMATRLSTSPDFAHVEWPVDPAVLMQPRRVVDPVAFAQKHALPAEVSGFRSLLVAPVSVEGAPPMAIALLARRGLAFSRSDQQLLERVCGIVAQAVGKRRLAHRCAVLAGIVDGGFGPAHVPGPLADPTFDALGHAYARIARWQASIVDITNDLLRAAPGAIDAAIDHALARTGALVGSDRIYVFRLRPPGRLDNTHEWVADGIEPMIDELQDMPDDLLAGWRDALAAGRHVEIPDVAALPDSSTLRDLLLMQGIQSLLAVPMLRDGEVTGFVGYDAVRARRRFLPAEIRLLQAVSNAITVVLERAAAEAAAEAAALRLQAERDRLRATLTAIPDLVLETDQEGRFTDCAAGSALGPAMPPEAFLGRMPEEVLSAAHAALFRQVLAEVDRSGYCDSLEYELEVDGRARWFQASATAKSPDGSPGGYLLLIRDITEVRRQQRQIRRLSRIAELTSNQLVITDAVGRIEWVNPAFEQRCGWSLDEVRGRHAIDLLLSERNEPGVVGRLREAVCRGEPLRTEILHRSRSGDEYLVLKDMQPLVDQAGKVEGFVSVLTDITALQEAHQRALNWHAMALEAANDGIAINDAEGRYIYANPSLRRIFGLPDDVNVRELTWQELCVADSVREFVEQELPKLQADGFWRGELLGWHRAGYAVPLDVTLSRTDDGAVLAIVRDVSKRLQAEIERTRLREELQIAQRQSTVAQIAAGVAHDLNNLVAVVSGTVSVLETQLADNHDAKVAVSRITRAVNAARDLVGGLDRVGRPDGVRMLHDLRDLVAEGVELLGTGRIRTHAVTVASPGVPQPVWANSTELLQVIVNLALNACQACDDETNRVSLAVVPPERFAPQRAPDVGEFAAGVAHSVFTVTDTGRGVEPEHRERLFDRYFTTRGASGTGLGLPIVAEIVQSNCGALWFDSEPGKGSTVTVAWPAQNLREAGPTARMAMRRAPSGLAGHKILVVDDVADVGDVLAEMLETDGAVAISLSDPEEALELLRETPGLWSALVTDLNMPTLSGDALARAASELEPPVPCVLVTALPESQGWDRSLFQTVLSKPTDMQQLIDAVRAAVAQGQRPSPESPAV